MFAPGISCVIPESDCDHCLVHLCSHVHKCLADLDPSRGLQQAQAQLQQPSSDLTSQTRQGTSPTHQQVSQAPQFAVQPLPLLPARATWVTWAAAERTPAAALILLLPCRAPQLSPSKPPHPGTDPGKYLSHV